MPADAAEVRRVTVTNNGSTTREIELTSYGEIVLAPPDADRAHPAFANLFVETEWHEWCSAITRDATPALGRRSSACGACTSSRWTATLVEPVTCETDRARFLGRGRSTRNPAALDRAPTARSPARRAPCSIRSSRCARASGSSPATVGDGRVHDARRADARARVRAGRSLRRSARRAARARPGVDHRAGRAARAEHHAGRRGGLPGRRRASLLRQPLARRAPTRSGWRNRGSQPLLWSIGISGDWPILLAPIDSMEGLPTLRQLLAAHRYWRRRGMLVDLVVLNTHPPTLPAGAARPDHRDGARVDRGAAGSISPGGVFVRRADLLAPDVLLMLRATARVTCRATAARSAACSSS